MSKMRALCQYLLVLVIGLVLMHDLGAFPLSTFRSSTVPPCCILVRSPHTCTQPLRQHRDPRTVHLPFANILAGVKRDSNRGLPQLLHAVLFRLHRLQSLFGLSPRPSMQTKVLHDLPFFLFINGKSGGQSGQRLLRNLRDTVHADFFCDLHCEEPRAKLSRIFELHCQQNCTDPIHVMCCGGDGTMRWIMDEVRALGSSVSMTHPGHSEARGNKERNHSVVFSLVPMGTGNDLYNYVSLLCRNLNNDSITPLSLAQLLTYSAEPSGLDSVVPFPWPPLHLDRWEAQVSRRPVRRRLLP
ncbi:hypothetical protein EON64_16630, partial [archaeon]